MSPLTIQALRASQARYRAIPLPVPFRRLDPRLDHRALWMHRATALRERSDLFNWAAMAEESARLDLGC